MAGLSFPIRLTPGGKMALSSGTVRIQEQILEILSTAYLSRVLVPDFGADELLFTPVTDPALIRAKIKFALDKFLDSTIETTVTVKTDYQGKVEVNIKFNSTQGFSGQVLKNLRLA